MSGASKAQPDLSSVAVLGMGAMGAAMARALRRAGFPVTVWNRTAEKTVPLVSAGAKAATDPADAVRDADVVLTMLFDIDATLDVASEFLPAMREGAIWAQSGTVGPAGMLAVHHAASSESVRVVDAPVLGTKGPAENAALTVLASGDRDAIAALQPVFDAIGSKTVVVGERLGAASELKLVCNTWVASLTAGTAQSIALARALQLDPAQFIDAIAGSASDSPYAHIKGATILDGAREPQFAVKGLLKDLRLAREAARPSHATAYLDALEQLYSVADARGHGEDDVAWVYESLDSGIRP
jgi:3-hydroxyisobutyrate dehydrogenase